MFEPVEVDAFLIVPKMVPPWIFTIGVVSLWTASPPASLLYQQAETSPLITTLPSIAVVPATFLYAHVVTSPVKFPPEMVAPFQF